MSDEITRKRLLKSLIFLFLFLFILTPIINAAYVKDIATISSERDANLTDNAATTTIPIIGDFRIRLYDIATISGEEDLNLSDNVVSEAVDVITATGFAREYIVKNIATLLGLEADSDVTDNADAISWSSCLTECVWGQNPFPDCACLEQPTEEACEITSMALAEEGIWCAGESKDIEVIIKEEGIPQGDIDVSISVSVEGEEFEFTGTTNAEGIAIISVTINKAGSYTLNAIAARDCGSRQLTVEVVICACLPGQTRDYICPDGQTITECTCTEGEVWVCITDPLLSCPCTTDQRTYITCDGTQVVNCSCATGNWICDPDPLAKCPPEVFEVTKSISCDETGTCRLIADVKTTKLTNIQVDLSEFSGIIIGDPTVVQVDGTPVDSTITDGIVTVPSVTDNFTITFDTKVSSEDPTITENRIIILIKNPGSAVRVPKLSIPMPDIGGIIIEKVLYTPMRGTQKEITDYAVEAGRFIINEEIILNPTTTSNEIIIELACICTDWVNETECGTLGCDPTKRGQTRICTPKECDITIQCIDDPECLKCRCTEWSNWTELGCGVGDCSRTEMALERTRTCTPPPGCAAETDQTCVADLENCGCKPRGEICSVNEDCCTGLCDAGACIACIYDYDCPGTEICVNGVCVEKRTPTYEKTINERVSASATVERTEPRAAASPIAPILEVFGIATQKAVAVCTLGTSCDTSADCHDSECINGKCVCCIKTCTSSRECCTGYCDNGYCKEPPSMALFAATTRISGCTGLIEECLPGERGCIYLCNGISILLAILALGVGFSFWKFYKNPIVSIIAMVIPAAIGFVTYPFVGIILALVMIGLMLTRR